MKYSWKQLCAFAAALSVLVSSVPYSGAVTAVAEDAESIALQEDTEVSDETEEASDIEDEADLGEAVISETVILEDNGTIHGEWGSNISYILDEETGALTVSGSGAMKTSSNKYLEMPFYKYRERITSVVFEEGITEICNYALLSCGELTSVKLPSTLTKIGYSAFEGCSKLTSVELPSGLETIERYAFEDCSLLEEITIPDTVTTLEKSVFSSCTGLRSAKLSKGMTYIPESFFYGCTSLETVNIPDGIETIGDDAFYNCKKLTSVKLPSKVTEIGSRAFSGCLSLSSVEISGPLSSIPDDAFYKCSSLKKISLPDSITSIGKSAFGECSLLVISDIPENVESIGNYAFSSCSSIVEINIPSSVKTVGDKAFFSCENLSSVVLSEGVESLGEYAFAECSSLFDVSLPKSIQQIGTNAFENTPFTAMQAGEFLVMPNGVLYEYRGTGGDIIIPDNVKSIASSLFKDNKNITSVSFPDDMESISDECFEGCTSLKNVKLPENLKSIGASAFAGCTALESVIIPSKTTDIGNECFSGCSELISVSLPEGLKNIGSEAFYKCELLTDVKVPETVEKVGVSAFEKTLFYDVIEDEMVIFGSALYSYNGNDKTVIVPEGITSITEEAFLFHMNIEKVILPDTLVSIGAKAFLGCHALSSVIVPDSVEEIGDRALGFYCNNGYSGFFENNSYFVILGSSDSAAQKYAEENDLKFTANNIEDNTCGENITFEIDFMTGRLTVSGKGEMQSYDSPNYYDPTDKILSPFYKYRSFIKSVVIEEGVTTIGKYAFYGLSNVTDIEMPSTITTISDYGFGKNDLLEELVIPEGVAYLGKYSLANESALKKVTLPDSLVTIDEDAFYSDKMLEDIALPDKLVTIGGSAFSGCTSLTNVDLPSSLGSLGSSVFYGCSSLQTVNISQNENYVSDDGIVYNSSKSKLLIYPMDHKAEQYTVPSSFTEFPLDVFKAKNLRCIVVPKNVTRLNGTISGKTCESLERIVFLGGAPKYYSYYSDRSYPDVVSDHPITITGSFTSDGWSGFMEGCTCELVDWEDKDKLAVCNTITINGVPEKITAGDSFKLEAKLNPILGTLFMWSSDNTSAAVISKNGTVKAIGKGKAVITCSTPDGRFSASAELDIEAAEDETGAPSAELQPYEFMEVDEETVGRPFMSKQFPCEKLGGMYFMHNSKLSFYSFYTKSTEWVRNFSSVSDAYEADGLLYTISSSSCEVFDLETRETVNKINVPAGFTGKCVGADKQGRIYIYASKIDNPIDKRIFLMNDKGEQLSETVVPTSMFNFDGFDSKTGRFYMENSYDFYSWGYHHPGRALNMGVVVGDDIYCVSTSNSFLESGLITRNFECIEYLCQDVYYEHQNGAELLGDRYVVTRSALTSSFTVRDANDLSTLMQLSRNVDEYEVSSTYKDYGSVGVRAIYNKAHDSIIMYDNEKKLTEYLPETGEVINTFMLKDYAYSITQMGERIIVVEKSETGEYSIEMIQWAVPEALTINAETTDMTVSTTQKMTLSGTTVLSPNYKWTSSDDSIVSVTGEGVVTAWRAGKAVISCDSPDGSVHTDITINVTARDTLERPLVTKADGKITNNASDNNYTVRNSPADSYFISKSDGSFIRFENTSDGIIAETYKADGKYVSTIKIPDELPIFGGLYSSDDAYYIVSGQDNSSESDSAEVLRVTKYSKSWERLGSCSVKGANTYSPFDSGDVSFAETNGKLYIHTSHEMYADSDGTHHQANMTYVLNMSTMKMEQSYYDCLNVMQSGYVSHSFSQYVRTDGKYVYRVDHGDGGPRAVAMTRCNVDGDITDVSYHEAYKIRGGFGSNETGVSVGGLELSTDHCLTVINSVDMEGDSYDAYGNRNIILLVTTKLDMETNKIQLTNYTDNDDITVKTPQIVKLGEDAFLIMWEEINSSGKISVKAVTCNGCGVLTSDVISTSLRISDCQPVLADDGYVKWYVTNGTDLSFYMIDPYDLENVGEPVSEGLPGDVNGDGEVDMKDAVLIRRYLADGWDVSINTDVADVNKDGYVDMKDVVLIRRYYAGGWEVTLK